MWASVIYHKGVARHLGYFRDELAAALAYEKANATLRPEGPRTFSSQYLGVNWNRHSKEASKRLARTILHKLTLSHCSLAASARASFARAESRWCAKIRVDGKQKHLGFFVDEHKAAQAYEKAAAEVRALLESRLLQKPSAPNAPA